MPLLIFLITLTLVSCSEKHIGTSNFTLKIAIPLADLSGGGVVVFGKRDSGDQFVRFVSDNTITELELNGTWSFGANA